MIEICITHNAPLSIQCIILTLFAEIAPCIQFVVSVTFFPRAVKQHANRRCGISEHKTVNSQDTAWLLPQQKNYSIVVF